MRIAFVSYDFGEYSVRHANALAAGGHQVLAVLAKSTAGPYQHMLRDDVDAHLFERPRFRQVLRQWFSCRAHMHKIRSFKPDVVHFQGGHLWFNFALGRLSQLPRVVTVHNPRHHAGDKASRRTPQWVMDYGYRQADRVIVHGEQLKKQCVEDLKFDARKVHVVPHIVMGDRNVAPGVEEQPHTVLFFGRIWEYKGLDYLIRAEPLIAEKIPGVKIVIAGEGEDFQRYRDMMQNPERFVVQNERVSDEDREAHFARCAVVALPYTSATQSGVIPVAYNHAKPVVATRTGSLHEVVREGETGLLVEPRDERALANAIIKLLEDQPLRHKMGQAARAMLDAESSPAVVAQHHLDVYAGAIDDHTRRQASRSFTPATARQEAV